MVNMNIPNLIGLVVLVIVFYALSPVLNTAINLLVPNLGGTASFIIKLAPVMVALAIIATLFEDEEPEQVIR